MPEETDPRQSTLNAIAMRERDERLRREANPYVELYRSRRAQSVNPPRQRPRGVSLLEQTMMEDRDNMLRVSIMDAPAPEHIARETRVARAAGQPPAMVADVDYAEKAVNANRLTKVSAAGVEIFDLHTYPDRVGELAGR